MGYMRHHTIVVACWHEARLSKAHEVATQHCGPLVSPIIQSGTNNAAAFFVAPDGSKEGWDTSENGDRARDALVEYLRADAWLDWVEVQFGDDERVTRVVRHNDEEG